MISASHRRHNLPVRLCPEEKWEQKQFVSVCGINSRLNSRFDMNINFIINYFLIIIILFKKISNKNRFPGGPSLPVFGSFPLRSTALSANGWSNVLVKSTAEATASMCTGRWSNLLQDASSSVSGGRAVKVVSIVIYAPPAVDSSSL
jgi:hypothetical protein